MIPSLLDFITIKNRIPKDLQDECISTFEKLDFKQYSNTTNVYNSLRCSFDLINLPLELCEKINKCVSPVLNSYKLSHQLQTLTGLDTWQVNRYTAGGYMKKHVDSYNMVSETPKTVVITIVVLLNDQFKGGEFCFFNDHTIELNSGDVLIFPGNFLYPHEVKPVLSGTRYSLMNTIF